MPNASGRGEHASEGGIRMKLMSMNVGLPREVCGTGWNVNTGIFKEPVEGRLRCAAESGRRSPSGSECARGTVQGRLLLPLTHYDYWKKEIAWPRAADGHVWGELHAG